MAKVISREVERAGFVLNKETGKDELMFSTHIGSALLTRSRAIEKANDYNRFAGREIYDTASVKVMQRETVITASDWVVCSDDK